MAAAGGYGTTSTLYAEGLLLPLHVVWSAALNFLTKCMV